MTEIIAKIIEYYPQIAGYVFISFLIGWVLFKMFRAFTHLEHKIDLVAERMATKEDLNRLEIKVGVIEEKVDVLWKRQLQIDGK